VNRTHIQTKISNMPLKRAKQTLSYTIVSNSEQYFQLSTFTIKRTLSRCFLLQVFLMNHLPPSPENNVRVISNFSKLRGDIRKSSYTIPVVNNGNSISLHFKVNLKKNVSEC
jgi:hypothetical protein